MEILRHCGYCQETFHTRVDKIAKGQGKYCSSSCSAKGRWGWVDEKSRSSRPYKVKRFPNHRLAPKSGNVPIHRIILFEAIGPGKHPCHHCGKTVTWSESLHVDHLDRNPANNSPENLAPSCIRCNGSVRRQGHMVADDELFIQRGPHRIRAFEVKCPCGS